MHLRGDDRAVTVQIGAILLFAALIVAMSTYQAVVVPEQNARAEYDHGQRVQADMIALRNAILRTGATGASQPTAVELGVRYPTRTVFVNPPPASGTLRTAPLGNLTLSNATAIDTETDDYWTGATREFPTAALVYEPGYREYGRAPATVYENSLLYNRFDGTDLTLADQRLVDGRRVTLVTVAGSLSRSRAASVSVDPRAISPASVDYRTVVVGNESHNVTLSIPTRLSAADWREAIGNESTVRTVRAAGPDAVEVVLKPGHYDLRMANVRVGDGTETATPHYITAVSGTDRGMVAGESRTVVAEVRDRYNNPVSGVTVDVAEVTNGDVQSTAATTDAQGRVEFTYTATAAGDGSVTLAIGDGSTDRRRVEYLFGVRRAPGEGRGGDGVYSVEWRDPNETGNPADVLTDCDDAECTWDIGADDDSRLSLGAVVDTGAEGLEVDFAINDTGVARVDPASGTTDAGGVAATELVGTTDGTVDVYVASGGSSDAITVHVVNASEGGGAAFEVAGGAAVTTGEDGVRFDVRNTGDEEATVTGFAVETDVANAFSGFDSRELTITGGTQNGYADRLPFFEPSYRTTGQRYQLSQEGQAAKVGAGQTVTVTVQNFQDTRFTGASLADPSGADLAVTLLFADGSERTFHLAVETV